MFKSILLAFAIAAGGASAQEGLRQLHSADATQAWQAVGRLDIEGHGFCTATLIAPDQALTAGHCLFDKTTGARLPTERIEFRVGWRDGRARAYRRVRRVALHPNYDHGTDLDATKVRNDLALLQLDHALRLPQMTLFETAQVPRRGAAVAVVSYAEGRENAPALQPDCSILSRTQGVLATNCAVDFGASGAPVFDLSGPSPVIVSVISAKGEAGVNPVSLGAFADDQLATLRAQLRKSSGPRVIRRPGGAGNRDSVGAKFLRP